jgi:hypothetical protein
MSLNRDTDGEGCGPPVVCDREALASHFLPFSNYPDLEVRRPWPHLQGARDATVISAGLVDLACRKRNN